MRRRYYDLEIFDTRELNRDKAISFLPKKIYKYFSINKNTLRVIREGQLWFSTPKSFNDPFDCKVKIGFGNTRDEIIDNLTKFLPEKFNHIISDPEMSNFFDNPNLANKLLNDIFS